MRIAAALLALLLATGTARADAPLRVASINLCADQLAVLLLPPDRIVALTHLAADPDLSYVADRTAGLPVAFHSAEGIVALKPDIVLAGRFTTRPTVALLKARGIPVIELDLPRTFDEIRAQVRTVAAAVGAETQGEALIAEMDRRLGAVRAEGPPLRVLTLAPGGFTAGAGTLSDAVMQAAGFVNYAATRGLKGYGYLSIEAIAQDPPELLVSSRDRTGAPSLSDRMLAHPALSRSIPPARRVRVPGALVGCGGPFTAEAVSILAAARPAADMAARLANGPEGRTP